MSNFAAKSGSPISGAAIDAEFAGKADANFASARAAALSRQVADKLRDFDAGADFGIVPDGSDQALHIAAAMKAMAAGGGRLYLRAGSYLSSQPWSLNSGCWIVGTGDATALVNTTANSSTVAFMPAATGAGLADLQCTAPVAQSDGAGSTITIPANCNTIHLNRLTIVGPFVGIRISSSVLVFIDRVRIFQPTNVSGMGILIDQAAGGAQGNDQYISNTFIEGSSPFQQPRCAVSIQSTGGVWLDNVGGLWTGSGLILEPGAGQTVEHGFMSRCAFDTGSQHGILVTPAAGGTVRRWQSTGDWCSTMQQNGIIVAGAGTVDGMRFDGARILNNAQHGFQIISQTAKNIRIGGLISGNSGSSPGGYDGINIAPNVTDFEIDARIGAAGGFGGSHRYAVYIAAGASDRYAVRGNLSGNITGSLSDGGTGTNKQIAMFGG